MNFIVVNRRVVDTLTAAGALQRLWTETIPWNNNIHRTEYVDRSVACDAAAADKKEWKGNEFNWILRGKEMGTCLERMFCDWRLNKTDRSFYFMDSLTPGWDVYFEVDIDFTS